MVSKLSTSHLSFYKIIGLPKSSGHKKLSSRPQELMEDLVALVTVIFLGLSDFCNISLTVCWFKWYVLNHLSFQDVCDAVRTNYLKIFFNYFFKRWTAYYWDLKILQNFIRIQCHQILARPCRFLQGPLSSIGLSSTSGALTLPWEQLHAFFPIFSPHLFNICERVLSPPKNLLAKVSLRAPICLIPLASGSSQRVPTLQEVNYSLSYFMLERIYLA